MTRWPSSIKCRDLARPEVASAAGLHADQAGRKPAKEWHHLDPRKSSIRIGMHGAEPWTQAMREEIEEVFDMDALDLYGLSEIIGPGVACECIESKDGLHLWEDHFYPEVIDPETGAVLPDGEKGELVFTSLTKQAFPIVRYRTRDLTRLLPGTARTMRRMEKVTGRSDDMLIIRGVNVFPSQIEEQIFRDARLSPHYLLEVSRKGRMDALTVVVEPRAGDGELGEDESTKAADGLAHNIKVNIGVTATVRVAGVGEIERSLGKAKRVVDLRST